MNARLQRWLTTENEEKKAEGKNLSTTKAAGSPRYLTIAETEKGGKRRRRVKKTRRGRVRLTAKLGGLTKDL
jgi:hypothetical protein